MPFFWPIPMVVMTLMRVLWTIVSGGQHNGQWPTLLLYAFINQPDCCLPQLTICFLSSRSPPWPPWRKISHSLSLRRLPLNLRSSLPNDSRLLTISQVGVLGGTSWPDGRKEHSKPLAWMNPLIMIFVTLRRMSICEYCISMSCKILLIYNFANKCEGCGKVLGRTMPL